MTATVDRQVEKTKSHNAEKDLAKLVFLKKYITTSVVLLLHPIQLKSYKS